MSIRCFVLLQLPLADNKSQCSIKSSEPLLMSFRCVFDVCTPISHRDEKINTTGKILATFAFFNYQATSSEASLLVFLIMIVKELLFLISRTYKNAEKI